MQTTKKISIFNGAIIVDKNKLDIAIELVSYTALFIVHKILIMAGVIFGVLSVSAAGDGHISDGDPKLVLIMLGFTAMCALAARVASIFMDTILRKAEKRRKNYK